MTYYRRTATDVVIRLTDGAYIPNDPGNQDWIAYQDWLVLGNEPEPTEVPPPIKAYCPVPVARERLEALGKWDDLIVLLFQNGNKSALVKLLTLSQGIDPEDEQARAMLQAIGVDPDIILATTP